MQLRTLKLFVVSPHNTERYKLIKDYIERVVAERDDASDLSVSVETPDNNPNSDRFNDWIFAQIDTCDLLVADMTGFNPNVVYEVAFAHSLGVPCAYLRFDESKEAREDIKHYFKFTLLPLVTEDELSSGRNPDFDGQIAALLDGKPVSGETILSDYYVGVSPIDAEFVRGLAEGYYRNFFAPLASIRMEDDFDYQPLKILIPDTFQKQDAAVRRIVFQKLGKNDTAIGQNSLGRPFTLFRADEKAGGFFYDVPTTLLTISSSHKYKKIKDNNVYFDEVDLDRLTDRLARRFATALWEKIRGDSASIEWPIEKIEIVWMSEVIGSWDENETLMNSDPILRPMGI